MSYKGGREKNLEDVHEFSLVVPTLEYHNVTWTWLDLFLAMKNDSKRVLLSQVVLFLFFFFEVPKVALQLVLDLLFFLFGEKRNVTQQSKMNHVTEISSYRRPSSKSCRSDRART